MQQTLETIEQPSAIETELVKHNVTEAAIAELRSNFLPLKINGVDDRKGYKEVDEARKVCKNLRVLATNICKAGREDAIKVQKAWISKEKEVTGQISEVEEHLISEIGRIDQEKEQLRIESERKEQERIQARVKQLLSLGCVYDGVSYSLEDVQLDNSNIKSLPDEIFAECLGQFKLKAEEIEAKRVEAERLAKEAEAEAERARREQEAKMLAERAELDRLRMEQEEREVAIRADQERVRKEQEAKELELRSKQEEIEEKEREAKEARIREEQENQRQIELQKAREDAVEAARLQAIEDAKIAETNRLEAERIAKLEDERQASLRPDKEKLQSFIETLSNLTIPDCTSEKAIAICNDLRAMVGKMQQHIITKVKSL